MKVLSLFSGIGAFEKALDNLEINYELVNFCEFDKYAVKSYCAIHNVEESKNLGDITKVDEKALPQNIDLITYGFPCQDISLAGKQKGLFNEDGTQTRSGLFFEALRIIEETKPRVAIAENVKNLTSKKFSEQFQIVLASLESAGYNNYWKVLNAKDYGIPQNRERVFIVSIRKDVDTGAFRFPEGIPLELRLKDVLEDEVDEKYYLSNRLISSFDRHKVRMSEKGNGFGWNPTDGNVVANTLLASGAVRPSDNFIVEPKCVQVAQMYGTDREPNPQAGRVYDANGISPTMDTCSGGNRMPKVLVREATKQGYAEAVEATSPQQAVVCDAKINVIGNYSPSGHDASRIVDENGIAPTVKENHGTVTAVAMRGRYNEEGKVEQQVEVSDREISNALTTVQKDSMVADSNLRIRKLTPKECFRLMGFDDESYHRAEAVNSNTQLYKQAGNSIVVPVVEYLFKALIEANIFITKGEEKEMEVRIEPYQAPGQISWNFEELKAEIAAKVAHYESLVYTDEQIKNAKADRANLNRLQKALNDERIRREREYMGSFNQFKAQVNELIEIIKKPVAVIDGQIKNFEEQQKEEKRHAIGCFFDQTAHPEWLTLEQIMNPKWLNASVNIKTVCEEINSILAEIEKDLATLAELPQFGFEATEEYKRTLDLARAIQEGQRLARIAEAKAQHEAEQARLKAEREAAQTAVSPEPTQAPAEFAPWEEAPAAPIEPVRQWVEFRALLSVNQAQALKEFFRFNKIEFEAIKN